MTSTEQWAQSNFGSCELGDKRRTTRLVEVSQNVLRCPHGSFPQQLPEWKDLKAAYRLFGSAGVTAEAIARPHWEATRNQSSGRFLILNDTSEFDFGIHREVEGLGPTGNGGGYGFLCHNALMVHSDSQEVIGLAGQLLHYRKPAPKNETTIQKLSRQRESQIWGTLVNEIGPPRGDCQWIHVCDRSADNFEFFCHLLENRCDWVVRCSRQNRYVLLGENGQKIKIADWLKDPSLLQELGEYELYLRARPGAKARTATVTVSAGSCWIPLPRHKSAYVRSIDAQPIKMQFVVLQEQNPPAGKKGLYWVLMTSLEVNSFEQAWQVAEYYETRWLIEEYHKAQKSGCRVTDRQLSSAGRLEASTSLLSIVAVRLLQLKTIARAHPDKPARKMVPSLWLKMLQAASPKLKSIHDISIGQFYRHVAMLGGFLGRKHDGQPGWITIWRGWVQLATMVRAVELAKLKKINE